MLSSFFSELQPPSRLHCMRCHKSYFEVDNDDRSCTIPHDDESAEVEHVRGGGFETRWDCCGRSVEGSGELGPPNGWCYEGRHTVRIFVLFISPVIILVTPNFFHQHINLLISFFLHRLI